MPWAMELLDDQRSARGLAAAIGRAIRSGALAEGDRLPPVREIAAQLAVSPTTVSDAWKELAASGAIVTRGRNGPPTRRRPAHLGIRRRSRRPRTRRDPARTLAIPARLVDGGRRGDGCARSHPVLADPAGRSSRRGEPDVSSPARPARRAGRRGHACRGRSPGAPPRRARRGARTRLGPSGGAPASRPQPHGRSGSADS